MKYAVVQTGGKQYKVAEGDTLEVEKLVAEVGKPLTLDTVLLYVTDETVEVGKPALADVTVTAKVLEQKQGEKIRVAKFKAKARYRKVYGHRQELTKIQIESIGAKGETKKKAEAPKETKLVKGVAKAKAKK